MTNVILVTFSFFHKTPTLFKRFEIDFLIYLPIINNTVVNVRYHTL